MLRIVKHTLVSTGLRLKKARNLVGSEKKAKKLLKRAKKQGVRSRFAFETLGHLYAAHCCSPECENDKLVVERLFHMRSISRYLRQQSCVYH